MDERERSLAEHLAQDYLEGRLSRRGFLWRVAILTGGSALALTVAGSLACGAAAPTATAMPAATPALVPAATATSIPPTPTAASKSTPVPTPALEPGMMVHPTDPRILAGSLEFPGDAGAVKGYLARPRSAGPFPAMLVVHENQGLLPHFADVARRLAVEGYAALAVDLASRRGGTLDATQGRAALREIPDDQQLADANTAVRYLQGLSYVRRDRVGVTGFCAGGAVAWLLAVRNPEIRAAVPFYGSAPPVAEVPSLKAAVLGVYAGNDTGINAGIPSLEAALKQYQKTYEFVTYAGADHAFFNPARTQHNAPAAEQSWVKMLGWLDQYLKK